MKTLIVTIFLLASSALTSYSQDTLTDYQLRESAHNYISEKMPSLQFAMISEVFNNNIRIAIVWPCITNGKFIDNDIIGLVFRKNNNKWILTKEMGSFNGGGKEEIVKSLGGDKFEIIKPGSGFEIDSIPSFIYSKALEIKDAVTLKKDEDVVKSIEDLSQCFSLNICGYDNQFANYVILGLFNEKPVEFTNVKINKDNAEANVKIFTAGNIINGKFYFIKSGNGWLINKLSFD